MILEYLGRTDLELKARTEYYKGTGTQKITLNHRPVYQTPVPVVATDQNGYYGAVSGAFTTNEGVLTYGTDFTMEWDQPDGTSKSAILVRIGNIWTRPQIRQRGFLSPYVGESFGNVKVTYTAGYTIDTLPAMIRQAANLLVAKTRYMFPLGVELASESFQQRSIGLDQGQSRAAARTYMMSAVKPLLTGFRNWKW